MSEESYESGIKLILKITELCIFPAGYIIGFVWSTWWRPMFSCYRGHAKVSLDADCLKIKLIIGYLKKEI